MALAMVAWMVPAWKDLDLAWKDQAMVVMEWEALDTAETGWVGPDMVETG